MRDGNEDLRMNSSFACVIRTDRIFQYFNLFNLSIFSISQFFNFSIFSIFQLFQCVGELVGAAGGACAAGGAFEALYDVVHLHAAEEL